MALSKKERAVLKEMFGCRCAYCGNTLGDRWHADHIEPVIRHSDLIRVDRPNQTYAFVANGKLERPENDRKDNFYPSCMPCNIHKSSSSVEGFRRNLELHIKRLNEATNHSIYRHAKRFGLVFETGEKVIFYFERCKENADARAN